MISDWRKLAIEIKGQSNWSDVLKNSQVDTVSSNATLSDILSAIHRELKCKHVGMAIAFCRIASYKDFAKFIREVRRNGTLRPSKYSFETKSIRKLIISILEDEVVLNISAADKEYLSSMLNILILADKIKKIRIELVQKLRPTPYRIIKSLLVFLDRAFWPITEEQLDIYHKNNSVISEPNGQSIGDLASGFSTMMAILNKSFNLSDKHTFLIDEKLIKTGDASKILQTGVLISEYLDAETLVDGFPFSAKLDDEKVVIEANDPLLEKSIRLGYVQTNLQALIRNQHRQVVIENAPNIETFAKQLYKANSLAFVELKREPLKRYIIKLPLIEPLLEILQKDTLFQDELQYLYEISIDSFLTIDELLGIPIDFGITIMDLVRIRRLYNILAVMFSEAIVNHPNLLDIDDIDMFSRVPVIHKKQLSDYFDLLFGEDKSSTITRLLIHQVNSESYFDLQYKPLIQFKDYVMFSLGVLANTNIIRNVFYEHSISIAGSLNSDPMQKAVEYGLKQRGLMVKENQKGKFQKKEIEIDIVAYHNGHLFIFECKNSYHPCGPHEMRTSFSHIHKAASQLSRAKSWLASDLVQKEIFQKNGWGFPSVKSIQTCILTANRSFHGFEIESHPVRHAHELLNVLGSGEIRLDDEYYIIRAGDDFTIDDLVEYLGNKGITHTQLESMTPIEISICIEKLSLVKKSYAFDFIRMKELAKENYKSISKEQYDKNTNGINFTPANMSKADLDIARRCD